MSRAALRQGKGQWQRLICARLGTVKAAADFAWEFMNSLLGRTTVIGEVVFE